MTPLSDESELYRTSGLPSGFFSTTGNLHMHVDGGGEPDFALEVLKQLETAGAVGKLNLVLDSVAGPQRALLPETYKSHTPTTGGTEAFEYFATVNLGTRSKAVKHLRQVLPLLVRHSGVVVEVERVISRIDAAGQLARADVEPIETITIEDVGLTSAPSLPFEIHHAFDLPKGSTDLPLVDLRAAADGAGVSVGGWFRFARRGFVAYRSNAFSDGRDLNDLVVREHRALIQVLQTVGIQVRLRTVVEEVLGIWRSAEGLA